MVDSSAPSPDRIEELLVPVLELPDAEQGAALEDLCSTNPDLSERLRQRYDLFQRMLASVPDEDGPRTFGEFELVRELGRGGMGVVYLARQKRGATERLVALKLVQNRGLFSSQARERFRREAEATFRLDHPVFCPVLDVGEVENTPFLAMRFVPGETLGELIRQARATQRPLELPQAQQTTTSATGASDPVSSGDRTDRILYLTEQVARALHVAHEAGLIHRDVKPGNIMVTPEGAPVLLDFGLVRDDSEDGARLTLTGQPLGTPAYMSPEQVSPEGRQLDRTTDVYSLGATLYEALTLRPPFQARTREELYREILTESPPDPRRLTGGIPRDLKVVLDTALDKDPNRRYATAQAVADDLRRARTRQPILARPAGVIRRLRLWTVRNRLASAILALLLVSQVAILFLADASQRSAEQANRERTRAIEHRGSARDAVAELVNIAERDLVDVPWLQPVRQQIYDKALAFYSELLEWESEDPTLRLDAAMTQRESADLFIKMGRTAEAEPLLAAARSAMEDLRAEGVEVDAQVARTLMVEARAAQARGDTSGYASNLEAAVETYRGVLEGFFAEDRDFIAQGGALVNLAALRRGTDPGDARQRLEEAHTVLDHVRSLDSHDALRARVYGESARLYRDASDFDAADREFQAAARALRQRLAVRNYDRGAKLLLGTNRISHGRLHNELRQFGEARQAYQEAIEIFEQLVADFPDVINYQFNLATSLSNLSSVERRTQNPDRALELLERSIEISGRLVAGSPDAVYREGLVRAYGNMAQLQRATSDEAALPYWRLGVETVDPLIAERPQVSHLDIASDLHLGVWSALIELGRHEEARAPMARARELAEQVRDHQVDNANYRRTYALVLYNEGWWLSSTGEPQTGALRMREAIAERQWLVEHHPNNPRVLPELLDAWVRLGWIVDRGEQSTDIWLKAETALADLIEEKAQALEEVPRSRFNLACYWSGVSRARAYSGDASGALAALSRAIQLLNVEDGDYPIAELVRCLTLRGRLHAAADRTADTGTAVRQAAEYTAMFDPEGVDGPARARLAPTLAELQSMLPTDTPPEHAEAVTALLQRLRDS